MPASSFFLPHYYRERREEGLGTRLQLSLMMVKASNKELQKQMKKISKDKGYRDMYKR